MGYHPRWTFSEEEAGPLNRRELLRRMAANQANVRFDDLVSLVVACGFREKRRRGSHCLYSHSAVSELLNLQNVGGQAKPYQVRQFLRLFERYNLSIEDEA